MITKILVLILLFASNAFALDAKLAWNQSTDSSVIGYKVYKGEESRNYNIVQDAKLELIFPVTNISNDKPTYFAVTAYSNSAESDFSEELTTIPIKVLIYGQGSVTPQSLLLTKGGSQTFTFTPVTGYCIKDVLLNGISLGNVVSYTVASINEPQIIEVTFAEYNWNLIKEAKTLSSSSAYYLDKAYIRKDLAQLEIALTKTLSALEKIKQFKEGK